MFQCRDCPRNCKRRARPTNTTESMEVREGSAQHGRASQETCQSDHPDTDAGSVCVGGVTACGGKFTVCGLKNQVGN